MTLDAWLAEVEARCLKIMAPSLERPPLQELQDEAAFMVHARTDVSTLLALVRRAVEALHEIANFQDNHWAMKAADDCLADLTRLTRENL